MTNSNLRFIRCTAIIVLMICGISVSAQNTLSVPFTNGFVGTVGNNSAKADNIQGFSTLGLTKVDFVQNSSGAVFEIQGNDIPGLVRFVSITGQSLDIEGAIVWRVNSGSTIEIFGFIPATTTSAVNLSTIGASNYVLDASSNIGMRPNGGTFAIVDGDNISGNAASAGLLDALNDYLATVIANRPAGSVTVNDESTTNSTPTLTGTVNYDTSVGETFTVNVDGVTYTTTSGISIVNQDWSLTLGATSIGTYEVTAVITDQSGYTLSNVGSLTISPPDITPPSITSGATGTDLVENTGSGQTIYTITATDAVGVTGYAIAGTDAALLSVNAGTGVVTLTADPNFNTKSSYSFTVTASDAATNTSDPTTVTFSITFSVVHNLNACDGDSDATIDLDALHSSNGVWTYSLDSDISGFASSSLLGSILTVDFSGANTGSGTIELSAQSGGNSGSIDVVVQESLYPYVTNMVPDGCSNANAEDGGAVFTFSGNYGSPVTVHYYLNAVNIFDSGTAKFAGYGDVQTKDSDASGNWKSVSSGAYWLYGYTNARGCFNPEPATSGVPTSSPKIKLLTVPYLLD